MVADPAPAPVTWGCTAGVVAPAAIDTLAGTVTLDGSLLSRATVSPPAGAGADKVTANAADCPSPTAVVPGTLMVGCCVTFTVAVAFGIPAAEAVIVTGPPTATPVTGTGTLVAPAANVTVAGTVALLVSLELRLTVKPPAGAGPDRFNVRFPELPTVTDSGDPVKFNVADTFTVPVPEV